MTKRNETHEENSRNDMVNAEAKDRPVWRWIKKNKKWLIAIGVIAVAVTGGIILLKNWDVIKELYEKANDSPSAPSQRIPCDSTVKIYQQMSTTVKMVTSLATESVGENVKRKTPTIPFEVAAHLRTLPTGQHTSETAIANANAAGIEQLPEHMTFVMNYTKNANSAA